MKTLEQITCKKCSTVNPAFTSICTNCKSYLRERIVNIDLWKTIGQLIEDPVNAFKQIIFAENKNFIIFITLFIAVKNLIIARFISVPAIGKDGVETSFVISYALILLVTIIIFSGFTFVEKALFKRIKINLRFKDIYAVNVYSFIPVTLSLIFVFVVEVVVLGGDIFSNNPNPYQIKPTISYILSGFEILVILWSIMLIFKNIKYISGKIFFSFLLTTIFLIILVIAYYISSLIIFTL